MRWCLNRWAAVLLVLLASCSGGDEVIDPLDLLLPAPATGEALTGEGIELGRQRLLQIVAITGDAVEKVDDTQASTHDLLLLEVHNADVAETEVFVSVLSWCRGSEPLGVLVDAGDRQLRASIGDDPGWFIGGDPMASVSTCDGVETVDRRDELRSFLTSPFSVAGDADRLVLTDDRGLTIELE